MPLPLEALLLPPAASTPSGPAAPAPASLQPLAPAYLQDGDAGMQFGMFDLTSLMEPWKDKRESLTEAEYGRWVQAQRRWQQWWGRGGLSYR